MQRRVKHPEEAFLMPHPVNYSLESHDIGDMGMEVGVGLDPGRFDGEPAVSLRSWAPEGARGHTERGGVFFFTFDTTWSRISSRCLRICTATSYLGVIIDLAKKIQMFHPTESIVPRIRWTSHLQAGIPGQRSSWLQQYASNSPLGQEQHGGDKLWPPPPCLSLPLKLENSA